MTMNRRALMQQLHDLRAELDEALSRAAAAEQELRDLRAVQHVMMQQAAPGLAFSPVECTRELLGVPLPPEIPATPIAEGHAPGAWA